MKRVTLTYVVEVDDDISDENAVDVALEIHSQDRHWPNDDDIKIEILPSPTETEERG